MQILVCSRFDFENGSKYKKKYSVSRSRDILPDGNQVQDLKLRSILGQTTSFRQKSFCQKTKICDLLKAKRIFQFLAFSILLFISNISLDGKSVRWIETFDPESSRRKAGFKFSKILFEFLFHVPFVSKTSKALFFGISNSWQKGS